MSEVLNIYQRKAKAMLALKSIPKNGWNAYAKYKYATDGDVLDTMRVLLAEHGIGWDVSTVGHEWNADKNRTIVKLEITLVNTDNPEDCVTVSWYGEANDKTDKGTVKAQTSGVKYFLLKTFLASAGNEADDADSTDGVEVRRRGPGDELATLAQKNVIKALMEKAGYSGKDVIDKALAERGYPKLALLKQGQISELKTRLEAKVSEKGKE